MIYYIFSFRLLPLSLSFIFERQRANCRGDFVGEVRGRTLVEAILRLRRRQHLDADLHGSVLWLRERNLLLQVSQESEWREKFANEWVVKKVSVNRKAAKHESGCSAGPNFFFFRPAIQSN
jgi:hypothetical protein